MTRRPDEILRETPDYWQAYNAPQIRRDRLHDCAWIVGAGLVGLIAGGVIAWLVLTVAPQAAAMVADPYANQPW